jgi:serine/threonine protein kinase
MQGKILYSYTLKHHIGTGGMAEVWYAENNLGKPAAIKIMLPKFVGEQQVVTRFENEAKAMVQLEHKNIRQVYDMGVYEQRPFIIMEYLEGQDLSQFIKQNQKPTESQLELWWQQCTDALHYTHQKNIIHRDIKPSNLFLTQSGEIKILDFGIAKVKQEISITGTGQGLGTLLYMSPQQILDPKRVTNDTDFYSLAVSFVHLMSGRSPYAETESQFKLQMQIVNKEVDMNGVSEKWKTRLEKFIGSPNTETTNKANNDDETVVLPKRDTPIDDKTAVIPTEKPESKVAVERPIAQEKKNNTSLFVGIGVVAVAILTFLLWTKNRIEEPDSNWSEKIEEPDSNWREKYDYDLDFREGLAAVIDELTWKRGFIDKSGKEVIPLIYDYANGFQEGLAKVKLNGKWGFVDKSGKEVVPLKYDYVVDFYKGLAWVELNGKQGFIDKSGNVAIPIMYDRVAHFKQGLAGVGLNGKCGFIDKSNNVVVPIIYDYVEGFSDDLAKVKLNGKFGFIDKSGNVVIPIMYDGAWYFSEGTSTVRLNGKSFVINKKGECVSDCP